MVSPCTVMACTINTPKLRNKLTNLSWRCFPPAPPTPRKVEADKHQLTVIIKYKDGLGRHTKLGISTHIPRIPVESQVGWRAFLKPQHSGGRDQVFLERFTCISWG